MKNGKEHFDTTPTEANLRYAARENALDAAIRATKAAYANGVRAGLDAIAETAYRTEYDAWMMAYRIAYKEHDNAIRNAESSRD